ncbi:MAG: type IV CRISPR-associated protein Csf2 [Lysobacterales bacterium 63-13]|nr:MAG: type IV CRISPR-associated protein Csf2 [Xanthomonadales bacterium 63-13]
MSLQIVGTIMLTTHAHQTAPDGRVGNKSDTIKSGMFCTDGRRRQIPFITANSVRGLLRRCAADRVMDALDTPISRQLFHCLTRGAASRSGIGAEPTVEGLVEGQRNVFAGLFGGGPYMLHSRYGIGPLLPAVSWLGHILHPSVRDQAINVENLTYRDADGNVRDIGLTTEIILTGKDDLMAGKGQDRIENYQQSLSEWLAHVTDGREAKAKKKAAEKVAKAEGTQLDAAAAAGASSDLMGFNFIEAMLPGTPLQFWLRLKPLATDAQVGLALMAVRDWANRNEVGGASARGFGRFEARLALYDDATQVSPAIFRPGDHATSYELSDDVAVYVAAAEKALSELTIEALEKAYAPMPEAKKVA